ncbi:ABC transporter permease, partial [Anaerosporobacter sp.]|uniref:ABC transporter permease n=1 Tax=Anaerosporobacter sp. TaxID=1872529 RepID=UPI002F412414
SKAKKIVSSKPFIMLVWVLVLVAIWEMGAANMEKTKRTPENVLPHVSQIVASVFSDKMVSNSQTATQIVWSSAEATLERAFIGFLFGTIFGFLMALLMKLSGLVEKTIFPYLMLIQMIPIIGMAPIILAITHDIGTSRIVIAAILTFYPVATNTLAGLNSVSKEKYELMYSYAASKWTIYRKVLIPSCIPYFFTGLKISAPMAITASILVDTLQGDGGLGCMLSQSLKHAMSIYVFWQIVFFSAFVGILSSVLMGVLEKLVSPQMRADRKRREKA